MFDCYYIDLLLMRTCKKYPELRDEMPTDRTKVRLKINHFFWIEHMTSYALLSSEFSMSPSPVGTVTHGKHNY